MIAFFGDGVYISLGKRDKRQIEKSGKVEHSYRTHWGLDRKIVLHVTDDVQRQGIEEPGFHLEAIPDNQGVEKVKEFHVFLSKSRFKDLINSKDSDGKSFHSRCLYDRCDINYFPI